jgi:hypothetical protein
MSARLIERIPASNNARRHARKPGQWRKHRMAWRAAILARSLFSPVPAEMPVDNDGTDATPDDRAS